MSRYPYNTAQWARLRLAKLTDEPLCEACKQREDIVSANVVDHIVAISAGGEPFPPLDGLRSLCERCHNSKTNAVDHPNASGFRRAVAGFDAEGNPIDPTGWSAPAANVRPRRAEKRYADRPADEMRERARFEGGGGLKDGSSKAWVPASGSLTYLVSHLLVDGAASINYIDKESL